MNPFKCSACGTTFSTKWNGKRHKDGASIKSPCSRADVIPVATLDYEPIEINNKKRDFATFLDEPYDNVGEVAASQTSASTARNDMIFEIPATDDTAAEDPLVFVDDGDPILDGLEYDSTSDDGDGEVSAELEAYLAAEAAERTIAPREPVAVETADDRISHDAAKILSTLFFSKEYV
jgi:hypothetical protein